MFVYICYMCVCMHLSTHMVFRGETQMKKVFTVKKKMFLARGHICDKAS